MSPQSIDLKEKRRRSLQRKQIKKRNPIAKELRKYRKQIIENNKRKIKNNGFYEYDEHFDE